MLLKLDHPDLAAALDQCRRGIATRRRLMMDDTPAHQTGLERALLDAVALFETLGIGYALVGGLAAMVYGKARFTEDVDFVAQAGHMDLLAARPDVMKAHRFDPGCTWKLYHDSAVAIDLWKDEHAAAIVDRARPVELAGRAVAVACVEDLVAMKLRADRPQDEYDISEILKHGSVDEPTLLGLITAHQAERYAQIKQRIGMDR